ncbi:MAG: 3-dehydro-bile acid delta(4,6)-reductase [Chlamydiia bacterium]|nr:3-dehydro-bile acid delta(4,6)-reductase [Chlamydiia bacterium]
MKTLVVIGGGPAGFFSAIWTKRTNPNVRVILLESSRDFLTKVKLSGGGRCNVTHHQYHPNELVKSYPRGQKELLGPFNAFSPKETVEFFNQLDVPLKVEGDGRMFPTTDQSQTIIDALLAEANRLNIELHSRSIVTGIDREEVFHVKTKQEVFLADALVLATGSHPKGHQYARELGHSVTQLVPSLFTFNVPTSPLLPLSGVSISHVTIGLQGTKLVQEGPLLLTHWGFSGPAALRLSAFAARDLFGMNYQTTLWINWTSHQSSQAVFDQIKAEENKTYLSNLKLFNLPSRLFLALCEKHQVNPHQPLCQIGDKALRRLAEGLFRDKYQLDGKTTNKEEFVTCGGIPLKEVNFKTLESKRTPNLYFAGEVLDVDGVTGGFNFQNCWTTGFLAGNAIGKSLEAHSAR